jgi:peptidoglycan DL-endopeptidase CwlO
MVTDRHSRRWWLVAVLSALLAVFVANPAAAEPGEDAGTPPTLKDQLEAANRGFLEAKGLLEGSRARQAELNTKIADLQAKIDATKEATVGLVQMAYRNNGLATAAAILASASPDDFVDRAATANQFALRNDKKLREFNRLNRELADTKKQVDAEVAVQEQQLAAMEKKKKDAEKAIAAVGGQNSGGFVSATSPQAQRAPRNSDGSWPRESCNVDDPTTGGCLTPRTLHAYNQTKAAGFTRFVSCYRSAEDGGEHPRGRACDWAADTGGFGGVASGASRTYGNNLAAYYVRNADNLGVLYVIWFRQIWQTATGNWKTYNGQCGNPACDHTNHVHLSVV